MKKLKFIIIKTSVYIIALIVFNGCNCQRIENDPNRLISFYTLTNKLSVVQKPNDRVINLVFSSDNKFYTNYNKFHKDYSERDPPNDDSWTIIKRNGDTLNFPFSLDSREGELLMDRTAFGNRLTNILITSDTDLSIDYPAGSSLNDLFYFFSSSPDQYLKNKGLIENRINVDEYYNQNLAFFNENFKNYIDPNSIFKPVFGKLSEIDVSKFNILLLDSWIFSPAQINKLFCIIIPSIQPSNSLSIKIKLFFEKGGDTELVAIVPGRV